MSGMAASSDGYEASSSSGNAPVSTQQPALDCIHKLLQESQPQVARDCCQTLTKIIWNILQNPTEEKFRTLRKSNKALTVKLGGPSKAALSFLIAIGFQDAGEHFTLPPETEFGTMTIALEALQMAVLDLEDKLALVDLDTPTRDVSRTSTLESMSPLASREGQGKPLGVPRSTKKSGQRGAFAFQPRSQNQGVAQPKPVPLAPSESDIQELRRLRAEKLEVVKASEATARCESTSEDLVVTFYTGDIGLVYNESGKVLAVSAGGQASACGVKPGWFIVKVGDHSINGWSKEKIGDLLKKEADTGGDYRMTFATREPLPSSFPSMSDWLPMSSPAQLLSAAAAGLLTPASSDARTFKLAAVAGNPPPERES